MNKAIPGQVIWFTGISGSGKTTLVNALSEILVSNNIQHQILDGDIVRNFFENDLGYTRNDRMLNVRRIAFTAHMLAQTGQLVLVANIAPYYNVRDFIRRKISNYTQIFVKADLETVMQRDIKGLYQKQKEGKMNNLIGVDDKYDIPRTPNLIVNTNSETIETSLASVVNLLKTQNIVEIKL